jgi:hypothetical protein
MKSSLRKLKKKRLLRRKEKEKQRFDEFDWIGVRSSYWMKTLDGRRVMKQII